MRARFQSLYGPLLLMTAAAIWGGMYVVSAAVLVIIPPWILLELRFLLGFWALAIPLFWQKTWRVQWRHIPLLALVGFIGYTCSIGLQFIGTAISGATYGSLITSSAPLLIVLFAAIILREHLTVKNSLGMLVAAAGVVIIIGLPAIHSHTQNSAMGDMILFAAAVTWALYTVLSRFLTQRYSSLTVAGWSSLFGAVFTLPIAIWQYSVTPIVLTFSPALIAGIVYLGVISTAVAFYLWNKGFEYVSASSGSLYLFVQPIVGGVLGAMLLRERLTPEYFTGAALIAVGVFIASEYRFKGLPSPKEQV